MQTAAQTMNPSRNIVVVDDEPQILGLMKRKLEKEGFSVTSASSADEAVNLFSQGISPDILITDLRMPGSCDGLELCRISKKKQPDTIRMIMTGYSEVSTEELQNEGVFALLKKPFSTQEFIDIVTEALELLPDKMLRQYQRIPASLDVLLYSSDNDTITQGKVCNISENGMFVQCIPFGEKGDTFKFEIQFGGYEQTMLSGVGKCVWKRENSEKMVSAGLGVEIIEITEKDREYLKHFIEQNRTVIPLQKRS